MSYIKLGKTIAAFAIFSTAFIEVKRHLEFAHNQDEMIKCYEKIIKCNEKMISNLEKILQNKEKIEEEEH